MSTHRVLVQSYLPSPSSPWQHVIVEAGELYPYIDKPNWKFEPLDPEAKAIWEETVADPLRLKIHNNGRIGREPAKSNAAGTSFSTAMPPKSLLPLNGTRAD